MNWEMKMRFKLREFAVTILSMSMAVGLTGCQTMGGSGGGMNRLITSCLVGGLAGAAIGGAVAGGKGAAIGGASGVALGCGIGLALDHYDKERIRQAQLRSLNGQGGVNDSWQGKDGKVRKVNVSAPQPVQLAAQTGRVCRQVQTSVQIQGKQGDATVQDIYCRTPEGDWLPA